MSQSPTLFEKTSSISETANSSASRRRRRRKRTSKEVKNSPISHDGDDIENADFKGDEAAVDARTAEVSRTNPNPLQEAESPTPHDRNAERCDRDEQGATVWPTADDSASVASHPQWAAASSARPTSAARPSSAMRGGEAWARAVARAETAAEAASAAQQLDPREFFARCRSGDDEYLEEHMPEPVTAGLLRRLLSLPEGVDDHVLDAEAALTIAVDTRDDQPVDAIGHLMPQLQHLHLASNSTLCSVRDLGTSLRHLVVLKASRCSLHELDGIAALPSLEELYLSFNDIWELSPLALHESLQVLDLEANAIEDAPQVGLLATIPTLWALTLDGNPLGRRYSSKLEYRRVVCHQLQPLHLRTLDDEPLTAADQRPPGDASISAPLQNSRSDASAGESVTLSSQKALHLDRATAFNRMLVDDAESQLVVDAIKRSRLPPTGPKTIPRDDDQARSRQEGRREFRQAHDNQGREVDVEKPPRGSEVQNGDDDDDDDYGNDLGHPKMGQFGSVLTHGGNGFAMSGNVSRGLRRRQGSQKPPARRAAALGAPLPLEAGVDEGEPPHAPSLAAELPAAGRAQAAVPRAGDAVRFESEQRFGSNHDDESEDAAIRALKARALVSRPSSATSSATSSEPAPHHDSPRSRPSSTEASPRDRLSLLESDAAPAGLGQPLSFTTMEAGAANSCTDAFLVALLQRRPKEVPELRTRSSFQRFFHGMEHARLSKLLYAAYAHLEPAAAHDKVEKRLRLFAATAD